MCHYWIRGYYTYRSLSFWFIFFLYLIDQYFVTNYLLDKYNTICSGLQDCQYLKKSPDKTDLGTGTSLWKILNKKCGLSYLRDFWVIIFIILFVLILIAIHWLVLYCRLMRTGCRHTRKSYPYLVLIWHTGNSSFLVLPM